MATNFFVTPAQQRSLRACMVCSLVQLQAKFYNEGCPNCEEYLHLRGSTERVQDATSGVYEGLITLADPAASWVARYQRLNTYVPGTYAVKVVGILPEDIIQDVEDAGVKYIPRDGSMQDEEMGPS